MSVQVNCAGVGCSRMKWFPSKKAKPRTWFCNTCGVEETPKPSKKTKPSETDKSGTAELMQLLSVRVSLLEDRMSQVEQVELERLERNEG